MSPALWGFIGYLVAVLIVGMATFRLTKTVADDLPTGMFGGTVMVMIWHNVGALHNFLDGLIPGFLFSLLATYTFNSFTAPARVDQDTAGSESIGEQWMIIIFHLKSGAFPSDALAF